MAVIALPNIDPQGAGSSEADWELRSLTARFPGTLGASNKTLERPGAQWAVRVPYANLSSSNLYRMQSFVALCRGQAQRFYLSPKFSTVTLRGSFAATELLTNNHFASGTTGWTSTLTKSVSDGVYRGTATVFDGTNTALFIEQSATVVAYQSYAFRALHLNGKGSLSRRTIAGSTSFTGNYGVGSTETASELSTLTFVPTGTTAYVGMQLLTTSGAMAGDYYEVAYMSLARCANVDNGPNLFDQSDAAGHANWTAGNTGITVTSDSATSPTGTLTGDTFVESVANSAHLQARTYTKSATAIDLCAYGYYRANGSRDLRLQLDDAGANFVRVDVTLSTGASVATSGGTWSNPRAYVVSAGNSWYYVALIGRTDTGTTARHVSACLNGGNVSYVGDGVSGMHVWRRGLAISSLPTRGAATTSAAVTSGTAQTGSALYLKGLPVSTSGLLLKGDQVEVITTVGRELKRVTASLDSDAAGLGYLQFEPPIRNASSDSAAVIICRPMMRASLDSNTVRWSEHDYSFSSLEFTAVEDVAA